MGRQTDRQRDTQTLAKDAKQFAYVCLHMCVRMAISLTCTHLPACQPLPTPPPKCLLSRSRSRSLSFSALSASSPFRNRRWCVFFSSFCFCFYCVRLCCTDTYTHMYICVQHIYVAAPTHHSNINTSFSSSFSMCALIFCYSFHFACVCSCVCVYFFGSFVAVFNTVYLALTSTPAPTFSVSLSLPLLSLLAVCLGIFCLIFK